MSWELLDANAILVLHIGELFININHFVSMTIIQFFYNEVLMTGVGWILERVNSSFKKCEWKKKCFFGGKKEFIILNSYLKSLFKHIREENNVKLNSISQSVHKD